MQLQDCSAISKIQAALQLQVKTHNKDSNCHSCHCCLHVFNGSGQQLKAVRFTYSCCGSDDSSLLLCCCG
jgi:hypothetical protein